MNDQGARETINAQIEERCRTAKGKEEYWWRMTEEHPTETGRINASREYRSLYNNRMDIEEAWKTVDMALWPEKVVDKSIEHEDI
jgi:hypothetical protein